MNRVAAASLLLVLVACSRQGPPVPVRDVAAEDLSIVDADGHRVGELSVADRTSGKRNDFWLFDSTGTRIAHIAQHGDCNLELYGTSSASLIRIRLWASSTMPAVDVAIGGKIQDYDVPRKGTKSVLVKRLRDSDLLPRIDSLLRDPDGETFASLGTSREGSPCIVFVMPDRTAQASVCATAQNWDLQLYRENAVMARAMLGPGQSANLALVDGTGKLHAIDPHDGSLKPFASTRGEMPAINQPSTLPKYPLTLRDTRGQHIWEAGRAGAG